MKNITVADIIDKLMEFPKDAVICKSCTDDDPFEQYYSSIEVFRYSEKEKFIDGAGNDSEGKIIIIY